MKYRIEISGRGGEVVIGRVKKEFYDLFDENELDFSEYAWNDDYFDDNEEIEIPEDIRPFEPGAWYDRDDVAHEYGVEVGSCYITVSQGDEVIIDNGEASQLERQGMILEGGDEIFPEEILDNGETYFTVQSYEKGFFQSYEFEAESFDLTKLTLYVTDIDGWELVTGAAYDDVDLEDLGELSTDGKGAEGWLSIVDKS